MKLKKIYNNVWIIIINKKNSKVITTWCLKKKPWKIWNNKLKKIKKNKNNNKKIVLICIFGNFKTKKASKACA